ncbi:MAG TPA: ABC transporter permease [Amycolatopsis sp.]|uniref:ABC transporter permease n=1 Tax=Amycolatopsis sp. TaxID=37632 RepID=UPI002B45D13C|nr:ABC transporter permease [Amycolatopsis sp.]HKS49196.1 ABC transporter permease [Amycolatopsis sp.]
MNFEMGIWQPVGLVASREISTRLRAKAYRISTLALLITIVGFTVVMKLIGGSASTTNVGFVAPTAPQAASLQATAKAIGQEVTTTQVADEAAGRAKVGDGSLDAVLIGDGTRVEVVVKKDLDQNLRNALNVVAGQLALNQQIVSLGGDPSRVNAAVANASVTVQPLEQPHEYNGQQLVLGIIAGILIYISLMLNGQGVAQGVVEEKTSRVVELLLATIRPWQLMAGKVLGIGAVGLLQVVLVGAVGIAAALGTGVLTISVSAAVGTVIWVIVWFLLGFLMYSIVFGGLGALVSRQEDVGGAVTPALMFVVVGYVIGISVLPSDPGNSLVEVLSIIPVFAPTLMPMRLAMGGVPVWEAGLSVVLVVAVIPALIWLSGRIYRNAVLRTGAKVRLREALRA